MLNTSTEYNQMYNKTISWNGNWILIFYLFRGETPSWSFYFIIFFIHEIIISYPNDKNLSSSYSSLLEGSSLNGEILIFNCSHLLLLFLWVKLKAITSFSHTFFAWIPWFWEAIQGGYHHFCILHFFFYCFKLFCILDLHILQLFSQMHILI